MRMTKDNMLNKLKGYMNEMEIKERHISMLKNKGEISIDSYLDYAIYSSKQETVLNMYNLIVGTYNAYDLKAKEIKERYNKITPAFNEWNKQVSILLKGFIIDGREY